MPILQSETANISIRSRLGETLLRLQRTLERSRQSEQDTERQFHLWRSNWSTKKEQIAKRLALIDAELERLVPERACGGPHLSIIGDTVDMRGISGMLPP